MTRDRGIHTMLGLCTAILAVAAIYLARPILAPVAFALLVIAIVWPFHSALQARLPQLLALAVTLLVTVVVVTALGSMVVWGFGRAGQWLIGNAARYQTLYAQGAGSSSTASMWRAFLPSSSMSPGWWASPGRSRTGCRTC